MQAIFQIIVFIYILFREIIVLNMQKLSYQPTRQLLRCPSTPMYQETIKYGNFTNTTINTSSSSIESVQDEYRKSAIKWLIQFDRKITKDTNYLSVWYLQVILKNGFAIKQSNWQLVAASIMLFASKMNQIYPPSISSILKRCKPVVPVVTKQSLIQMQGKILNLLNFNVAIQSPFNLISQILNDSKKDIEECQKLLKIIIYNKQINQQQSQILAYAIIYLIARTKIDAQLHGQTRMKVKIAAQKMYNYYKEVRKSYQNQKAKQKLQSLAQDKNYSTKASEYNSAKQNSGGNQIFSSLKNNQILSKKSSEGHLNHQINRVNSYKFIPKQKPFTQTTNIVTKQKKLYHCVSRDDLKDNYRNVYLYS